VPIRFIPPPVKVVAPSTVGGPGIVSSEIEKLCVNLDPNQSIGNCNVDTATVTSSTEGNIPDVAVVDMQVPSGSEVWCYGGSKGCVLGGGIRLNLDSLPSKALLFFDGAWDYGGIRRTLRIAVNRNIVWSSPYLDGDTRVYLRGEDITQYLVEGENRIVFGFFAGNNFGGFNNGRFLFLTLLVLMW